MYFDELEAVMYGLDEAIMISNLRFWILKNKANNKHFYDGHYWTYNTQKAFSQLFPFWNRDKIQRILKSLEKQGIIIKGNYNKVNFDRTQWFAFANEDGFLSIVQNKQIDSANLHNPLCKNAQPIPDINTDINTDIISEDLKSAKRIIDYFNEVTGKSYKKIPVNTDLIRSRLKDYSEEELCQMIKFMYDKWGNDSKMCDFVRPSTLFRASNCENYVQMSKEEEKEVSDGYTLVGLTYEEQMKIIEQEEKERGKHYWEE